MNIQTVELNKKDVLVFKGYFSQETKEEIVKDLRARGIENAVMFMPSDVDLMVLKQ